MAGQLQIKLQKWGDMSKIQYPHNHRYRSARYLKPDQYLVIELHTAFQNLFMIWHFSGQLVDGDQAGAILRRARQTVQANCPTSNFSRKGQAILIKMPTILKISKIPALYTMLSQRMCQKIDFMKWWVAIEMICQIKH